MIKGYGIFKMEDRSYNQQENILINVYCAPSVLKPVVVNLIAAHDTIAKTKKEAEELIKDAPTAMYVILPIYVPKLNKV